MRKPSEGMIQPRLSKKDRRRRRLAVKPWHPPHRVAPLLLG
jgi:hypothetical protein